jgi:transposase InsO family protein
MLFSVTIFIHPCCSKRNITTLLIMIHLPLSFRNLTKKCIDVFSKHAFAVPLKDKRGLTLAAAFEKIFSDTVPDLVQSDRGTEFLNSHVQEVFKKYNIRHYWSLNDDIKAACVERFNRTLKGRMYRYFTARHTNRWIDVLQSLINS